MATATEPKVSFDNFIVGMAASLTTGILLLLAQSKINQPQEVSIDFDEEELRVKE